MSPGPFFLAALYRCATFCVVFPEIREAVARVDAGQGSALA